MKPLANCLVMGFCLLCELPSAQGDEPVEQYIQGLKERGYFDSALAYLEASAAKGTITAELRERLDYERAAILVEGLRIVQDENQRNENLDQAQELLTGFIENHPRHPYVSFAQRLLGELLVGKSRLIMEQLKSNNSDEEHNRLLVQSREFFKQAIELLNSSRAGLRESLIALDSKLDATANELRRKYQIEYLRVRLMIVQIAEDLADTYPKNSMAWREYLEQAIDGYDDYAKDYHNRIVGLRARSYQARCHEKLGNVKQATTLINDLLDQPDNPALYDLKRDACLLGAKVWFAANPPQYLLAIQKLGPLVDAIPAEQATHVESLELQYSLARAYLGFAKQLENQADKTPEDILQQQRAELRSIELIRGVAGYPSEFKKEAQELLVELGFGPQVNDDNQTDIAGNTLKLPQESPALIAPACLPEFAVCDPPGPHHIVAEWPVLLCYPSNGSCISTRECSIVSLPRRVSDFVCPKFLTVRRCRLFGR
jgi:hypothetical protein